MQQGPDETSASVTSSFETSVLIEGAEFKWRKPTITTEEIAQLGGWPPENGVIIVDADNNERTLAPGEVVHLALSLGSTFGRRVRFKRGRADRMRAEVDLLRAVHPGIQVNGQWILLPQRTLPDGWSPSPCDIAILVPDAFPGTPPYGIYVPSGLRFRGEVPRNYTDTGQPVPFPGSWGVLSWAVDTGWFPTATVAGGANLRRWVHGFDQRFAEGL